MLNFNENFSLKRRFPFWGNLFLLAGILVFVAKGVGAGEDKPPKWLDQINLSGNLAGIVQRGYGDGSNETIVAGRARIRGDFCLIPKKLGLILRLQAAGGDYLIDPGQILPINNIATDKPSRSENKISRDVMLDYLYFYWKPFHNIQIAIGLMEPWSFDPDTREGFGGWLNGIDDHAKYLNNLSCWPAVKHWLSTTFREIPAITIRYDPVEDWRIRAAFITTGTGKGDLLNPQWTTSENLPDYDSIFMELEYMGKFLNRECSYRFGLGAIDTYNVMSMPDPDEPGFSVGFTVSQRLFSDNFMVCASYSLADDSYANRFVDAVEQYWDIVLTYAWGGPGSADSRWYNFYCNNLLMLGIGKYYFFDNAVLPFDYGPLKAFTPIVGDETGYEICYRHRFQPNLFLSLSFQAIENPAAGHENWTFIPGIGLSIDF